jgi:hypothetical protein
VNGQEQSERPGGILVLAEPLEARQAGDLELLTPAQSLGNVGELADLLDDGPWDGWVRIRLDSPCFRWGCRDPGWSRLRMEERPKGVRDGLFMAFSSFPTAGLVSSSHEAIPSSIARNAWSNEL